jgi:hypothetical protein
MSPVYNSQPMDVSSLLMPLLLAAKSGCGHTTTEPFMDLQHDEKSRPVFLYDEGRRECSIFCL